MGTPVHKKMNTEQSKYGNLRTQKNEYRAIEIWEPCTQKMNTEQSKYGNPRTQKNEYGAIEIWEPLYTKK